MTFPISTMVRTVSQISWRVPDGPMGVMGWQISMGGVKVFPTGGDLFVIANKEHGDWMVTDAPDSGAWQVTGYNTGTFNHSVYLAFYCDSVESRTATRLTLPAHAIGLSPDLSAAGPPVRTRM